MTAEEVALNSFRNAVERARMHREAHAIAERNGSPTEQYAHWRLASNARDEVSMLARIIRAIRAERTPFHAMEKRLADSIEGGIEAGIELIKARAYEQGRLDALRGVQAAALYHIGGRELDIEACELARAAAQAAEEAAR